jgi:nucleoside transporter
MTWDLYLKLSAMMFLQFAVWGAWYPVIASRLLGPLKFSGKQTGWIYAALPLACIVAPLIAGHIADKWVNAEMILAVCHLAGMVLLFVAAWKRTFAGLFITMLLYSFFYAATLPLVNTVMFHHLNQAFAGDAARVNAASPKIFLWAPVAWALAGYLLTGIRWAFKTEKEGRDCLILAASLSLVMAVVCGGFMPHTPPAKSGGAPIVQAIQMLTQPTVLVFILISILGAGMQQFYFQGSAAFLQDKGIAARNVPASMAIAQVVQALATWFLLGPMLGHGYKWTMLLGAGCWLLLFAVYTAGRPTALLIAGQSLHGFAYVFFIIAGQIFANSVAPKEILGSMQAMVFVAQSGVGLFLGSQLAGVVMDKSAVEGRFQWGKIFPVPLAVMIACVLALLLLFRPPTA